jgi:hypothetical protein
MAMSMRSVRPEMAISAPHASRISMRSTGVAVSDSLSAPCVLTSLEMTLLCTTSSSASSSFSCSRSIWSAWRGGRRRRRRQGFTAPFALVLSSRRDLGSLALGQRAAAALRTAAGAAAGAAAQAFTNAAQAQLPPLPPLPPRRCSERSDGQRELCCGGVAAPREGRCSEGLALRLRRVALAW